MKKFRLGQGATVFFLFFGVALLEAFRSGNFGESLFWIAVGAIFLVADNLRRT
ncbi:MAG TPA: hypothetical protein VF144_00965 [Chitinophagaceae bacterium]